MSNQGVAVSKTDLLSANPVINRQLLWEGGTVSIKIPTNATIGSNHSPSVAKHFLKFKQNVRGGVVTMHYHDGILASSRGKKVLAHPQVWLKILDDGQEFLYIDLHPVSDQSAPPTKHLAVMPFDSSEIEDDESFIIFKTPAPLTGTVVIAPVESKINIVKRW